MRCLGIDFGLKKTGLALGESESKIASPLYVVPTKDLQKTLNTLIAREDIECIVIGKPNHHFIPEQEKARMEHIHYLQKMIPHVIEVDEQYTTKESRALQNEGLDAEEDAIAAQLILDAYFSEL